MQEIHSNTQPNYYDDKIDLQELFGILLHGKWIILSVTSFISIIGVIYSLLLPNIYESRALLAPANSSGSISNALRGSAGIARIPMINLPSNGESSNSRQAIVKVSSLSFFEKDILPNIFLPDLMALKSWDSKRNNLVYDNDIYDKSSNAWIKTSPNLIEKIPTPQESFKKFKGTHLNVKEDEKTGFVTISIKHQSPFIAKEWTDLIVKQINSFYRKKDKAESEKAVNYLNQKIAITNLSEVKQSIAELLQEETQKLTLIEANEFYVFDYIDNPAVMEKKSEPIRVLIINIFILLGAVLGVFIVLIKHYFFNEKLVQSSM